MLRTKFQPDGRTDGRTDRTNFYIPSDFFFGDKKNSVTCEITLAVPGPPVELLYRRRDDVRMLCNLPKQVRTAAFWLTDDQKVREAAEARCGSSGCIAVSVGIDTPVVSQRL
ncbi:hypothetical protein DPMN_066552 [Dreissena polymorpha]|uniref:Uncharacterized protein n=1 Tax=Dreissena polymorpha TaxID=45954 RepID=A0A9D3YY35_DREPO|nr:hypothetical protein DPMN_066552 [Dreissena polymorpha]